LKKCKLEEIVRITGGTPSNLDLSKEVTLNAVIDSSESKAGTFFAAFVGENVDGHNFVESAIKAGAEFALVSKKVDAPHILVEDVTVALSKLAKFNRDALSNLKVVAITGSQGKTTAKDLTAHLLATIGTTVAPKASLNNELGVPLLLLQCNEETKYCVVEMGARHKGDIAHLVEIASPDIGVVLNVGHAHVGEFGSREKIAETKGELIAGLPDGGVAILGNYDPFTPKMAEGMGLKKVIFGESSDCDVRAADVEIREGRANFDLVTSAGRAPVSLQFLGSHQISNALAAAAIASELGMGIDSIAAALSTAEPMSKWRMELIEVGDIGIINDSYNANPESMAAAIRTLALLAQERGGVSWAILGKMHELGASSVAEDEKIGKIAADIGIDNLISIGVKEYITQGETVGHLVSNRSEVLKYAEHFAAGDVLLVKASRAEEFNLLVSEIVEELKKREVGQ
jgi:UDP-N-acetylmuramoyl-tripeptide--D-alanyl-D-alanine ligase